MMKMYQVDAFTQQLFKGNPAAVLVLDEWLDVALMQNIALENNLAETAFVKVLDTENYEIRWFTPKVEVDFCGHATLASAFVLFKDYTQAKTIKFHVKDLGIFTIQQAEDGKIQMNFPIRMPKKVEDYPEQLNFLVDQAIKEVYVNAQAYILVLESAQAVKVAKPNLHNIEKIALEKKLSTAITAPLDGFDVTITADGESLGFDYVARY